MCVFVSDAITNYSGDVYLLITKFQNLSQCFIFNASDRSGSLSLTQITHLGSDLSLALITIIAPVTSLQHTRGWSQEATKNVLNANKMTDKVNDVFRCDHRCLCKHKILSK